MRVAGFHATDPTEVLKELNSDPTLGLTEEEVTRRLARYGSNQLQEAAKPGFLAKLREQLTDYLVLILIAAAAVSTFLGEFVDAAVIMAIVVLNAIIGIIQEAKAEEALESLKKMATPNAQVIRDGEHKVIPAAKIVPGDIVLLYAGDKVPCDLRLIETQNLQVDEAPLTGESVPVEKDAMVVLNADTPVAERRNMAYFGTAVTYGRGKGVAVATGMGTELGKIAGALQEIENEKTPLQQNLEVLGKTLGTATLLICILIFGLGLLRNEPPLGMFLTAVSLAVAAIPEGLPAVVTVVLAIGVKQMVAKHAIMRKLAAVETLGCTTVICSDKTGTLTQNQMTVVKLFAGGKMYRVEGRGYDPVGAVFEVSPDDVGLESMANSDSGCSFSGPPGRNAGQNYSDAPVGAVSETDMDPALQALLVGGVLNNDAILEAKPSEGDLDEVRWGIVGDPTEGALIVAAKKLSLDKEALENIMPRVAELPFDSGRKRMTTFHQLPDERILAVVKGAPETIVGLCRSYVAGSRTLQGVSELPILERSTVLDEYLEVLPITPEVTAEFSALSGRMASNALRVIAVALRFFKVMPEVVTPEAVERDLTMVGLFGMIDPPRPEVLPAVEKCKRAGIIPVMITGDSEVTAVAIARALKIYEEGALVISGRELSAMTTQDLESKVMQTRVYGRVSPEHKMMIVAALKSKGQVVAMTGDGVNDAPALKKADIGIAMGITGTDVAKETADMILSDDNFTSIVAAVEQGRIIYSNIAKFVVYLLSCNIGEILTILFGMLLRLPTVLKPVQLLLLNLVTDSLPALALGFEKGEPDIMDRPPREPGEPILTRQRWVTVLVQAALIAGVTIGAFLYGMQMEALHETDRVITGDPYAYSRTMAFAVLVTSELVRAFTARSERNSAFAVGLFANRIMLLGTLVSGLLLLAVVEIPLFQPVFFTSKLVARDWVTVLVLSLVPAIGAEVLKLFRRRCTA